MPESSADGPGLNQEGLLRRSAIKKIGLMILGISIASIGGMAVFGFIGKSSQAKSRSITNESNHTVSVSSTVVTTNSTASYLTIKVAYFGMSTQTTGTKQEYITLESPAFLQDAISEVTQRHPALIPMIGAMQILIDGNPAEPNEQLENKDEIDFIALLAGG